MVSGWFCELCYGVVGSEGDSNISVFKQVGNSAYVWGGKGEVCPFWAIISVCGGCDTCYSVLCLMF